MLKTNTYIRGIIFSSLIILITNCGGVSSSDKTITDKTITDDTITDDTITDDTTNHASGITNANTINIDANDDFSKDQYAGLHFYYKKLSSSSYKLTQLDDASFNALNSSQKLLVANKLLSTLFFGLPHKELKAKIDTGNFISAIKAGLDEDKTDKEFLEEHIVDKEIFQQVRYNEQVAVDILTRFYVMKDLDSYFLKNWVAYILTQTIMFSPAYELESSHTPNIARIYNRLVTMLDIDSGMRYITYVHMMSEDNWRRFRSPEDNGREMMEIFTLDMDDSHVPIAGQALKNWKLDRDNDTLVVSLNENRQPLKLFGTTIYNGDDFYREMTKSSQFANGVVSRLVDFFFPNIQGSKKTKITNVILKSKPETWQDILLQIVFSEEYLLNSTRAKSAEELFFALAKKLDFKHKKNTFHQLKTSLEDMHQASMKYKLGKLKRVPLDTLSFANYHKYIRQNILIKNSNPNLLSDYEAWGRQGWGEKFLEDSNYILNETDGIASLESLIQYIFKATISRNASNEEIALFKSHMIRDKSNTDKTKVLRWGFNLVATHGDIDNRRKSSKRNIAVIVLDYISRLSETYIHAKVN